MVDLIINPFCVHTHKYESSASAAVSIINIYTCSKTMSTRVSDARVASGKPEASVRTRSTGDAHK